MIAARRLGLAVAGCVLATCAQPSPPPGGPPDLAPPVLLRTTPDSAAVNVRPREIVFQFDEVVSERPQSAPDLRAVFTISPRDGEPIVRWRRDAITVRPSRGWRDNTVYTITMQPGVADLRGNVNREGARLVFSTGLGFPPTLIAGQVFDWSAGRPARGVVEALNLEDSTTYVSLTDSSGAFHMEFVRPGRYAVRTFVDGNNNRRRDAREIWDSVQVTLRDSARVELLAIAHDTIGPRIASVVVRDSVTLRVTLDQPMAPDSLVDATQVRLTRADSTRLPIALVVTAAEFERLETEQRRQRADSARMADSLRRAADTTARAAPPPAPPVAARPDTTAADTVRVVRPSRPAPPTEIVIRLAEPLARGAIYRLRLENVRGLLGAPRTSERVFSTPRPAPPRDTTNIRREAGDTTARRPPAPRP